MLKFFKLKNILNSNSMDSSPSIWLRAWLCDVGGGSSNRSKTRIDGYFLPIRSHDFSLSLEIIDFLQIVIEIENRLNRC